MTVPSTVVETVARHFSFFTAWQSQRIVPFLFVFFLRYRNPSSNRYDTMMFITYMWVISLTSGIICVSDGLECRPEETLCRFSLFIEPKLTMMNGKTRVRPCNGRLCNYDGNVPLDQSIEDNIITTDGVYSRLVISVNDTVPGPSLIVYEDQKIEVLVTNNLHTDSVTIHFHGAHQRGTPFMDGVAYVTQCPIHPGHTFNYTFDAKPHGTHWYHAHIGDQRSMGLYGPYIVRRREEPPQYIDKHVITLQDWNHDMDPETAYQKMLNGIYNCELDGTKCTKYNATYSVDGGKFSAFEFHSGLINGRGRYYINGKKNKHNNAPLTTYTVEKDKLYRFRVISAATLYPFRLYVAGHKMTIVASDGRELKPVEVESFVIHTGERMDFILNTSRSEGDYMIVAETLEVLPSDEYHAAEAILHYSNFTTSGVPDASPVQCSEFPDGFCPVFNCPFRYFEAEKLRNCITFHEASASPDEITPDYSEITSATADQTFFLNFAFPGTDGNTPGSVNGRQYLSPKVSAYSQPKELDNVNCDKVNCEKTCKCMYTIKIYNDQIIDLVFLNMGIGRGWSHPVHLHGHSFYVVAIGFPEYNPTTGRKLKQNTAVDCRGAYCNDATWTGRGRKKRQTDDTSRIAPLKDTIVVPTDGYVIVRFKADNPGAWFLHCHIDLHNTNGMAMVVNESFSQHPASPKAMPRCQDYRNPGDMRVTEHVGKTMGLCGSMPLIVFLLFTSIFTMSTLVR